MDRTPDVSFVFGRCCYSTTSTVVYHPKFGYILTIAFAVIICVSQNEDQTASGDPKGKHGVRRPPTATTSMSIPVGVSPKAAEKQSSKHKAAGKGGMDLDTIAVRTPGADRSALKELPALRYVQCECNRAKSGTRH
jgi:hypothetical protein